MRTTMTTTVFYKDGKPDYGNQINSAPETVTYSLAPTEPEIVRRIAWAAPLSIAVTLATLWAIRRLKSRCRHRAAGRVECVTMNLAMIQPAILICRNDSRCCNHGVGRLRMQAD